MTRNQTIAVFCLLAVCAVAPLPVLLFFGSFPGSFPALLIDAALVIAVGACAAGCFAPNSPIFGRVVHGDGVTSDVMALTFDDGPSPDTTPRILDTLKEAGARATFFVLGKHAVRHPELVQTDRGRRA